MRIIIFIDVMVLFLIKPAYATDYVSANNLFKGKMNC
jgi:hypothetical protein